MSRLHGDCSASLEVDSRNSNGSPRSSSSPVRRILFETSDSECVELPSEQSIDAGPPAHRIDVCEASPVAPTELVGDVFVDNSHRVRGKQTEVGMLRPCCNLDPMPFPEFDCGNLAFCQQLDNYQMNSDILTYQRFNAMADGMQIPAEPDFILPHSLAGFCDSHRLRIKNTVECEAPFDESLSQSIHGLSGEATGPEAWRMWRSTAEFTTDQNEGTSLCFTKVANAPDPAVLDSQYANSKWSCEDFQKNTPNLTSSSFSHLFGTPPVNFPSKIPCQNFMNFDTRLLSSSLQTGATCSNIQPNRITHASCRTLGEGPLSSTHTTASSSNINCSCNYINYDVDNEVELSVQNSPTELHLPDAALNDDDLFYTAQRESDEPQEEITDDAPSTFTSSYVTDVSFASSFVAVPSPTSSPAFSDGGSSMSDISSGSSNLERSIASPQLDNINNSFDSTIALDENSGMDNFPLTHFSNNVPPTNNLGSGGEEHVCNNGGDNLDNNGNGEYSAHFAISDATNSLSESQTSGSSGTFSSQNPLPYEVSNGALAEAVGSAVDSRRIANDDLPCLALQQLNIDESIIQRIDHSLKFQDDVYEFRYVVLPQNHPYFSLDASESPRNRALKECEWRLLGIRQTRGWVHRGHSLFEANIFLFRRPLCTNPKTGELSKEKVVLVRRRRGEERRVWKRLKRLTREANEICRSQASFGGNALGSGHERDAYHQWLLMRPRPRPH